MNEAKSIHEKIENGTFTPDDLRNYIQKHPLDKHIKYGGKSAASVALITGGPQMYGLLVAFGIDLASDETVNSVLVHHYESENYQVDLEKFVEIKNKCRQIQRDNSKKTSLAHVAALNDRSKIPPRQVEGRKSCSERIYKAFEELNNIPWIKPILHILACDKDLTFMFDFDETSVERMDPNKTPEVKGTTYTKEGTIYIGAKGLKSEEDRWKVYGTLIHEMCHYAMKMLFNNDSKPYFKGDKRSEEEFEVVARDCCTNLIKCYNEDPSNVIFTTVKDYYNQPSNANPVSRAFFSYGGLQRLHAELIVRVPQMLALYLDEPEKLNEMKLRFNCLFNFYEKIVLKQMQDRFPIMEEIDLQNDVNHLCGVLNKIKRSEVSCNLELFSDSNLLDFNFGVVASNCVSLTLKFLHQMIQQQSIERHFIWTKLESFADGCRSSKIGECYNLTQTKPIIIVDCEDSKDFEMKSFFKSYNIAEGCVLIMSLESYDCDFEKYPYHEVYHVWSHLSEQTKTFLFAKPAEFQGRKVKLSDILMPESSALNALSIQALNDESVSVGREIKFDEIKFHVERFLTRDNINYEAKRVFELSKEKKVVLLSDEPGMGKTVELKMMALEAKSLSPHEFVIYWDLKLFHEAYEKDELASLTFNSKSEVLTFICEKILQINDFEAEVFVNLFDNDRVVMFIDGFDEISPSFKTFITKLLVVINQTHLSYFWISTRPHFAEELERKLDVKAYNLIPFTDRDSKEFFKKFFYIKNAGMFHDKWIKDHPNQYFQEDFYDSFDEFSDKHFYLKFFVPGEKEEWLRQFFCNFFHKRNLPFYSKEDQKSYFLDFVQCCNETLEKIEKILQLFETIQVVTNPLIMMMIAEVFSDSKETTFVWTEFNFYTIYDVFTKKVIRTFLGKGIEAVNDAVNFFNNEMSIIKFFQIQAAKNVYPENLQLIEIVSEVPSELTFEEASRVGFMNGSDMSSLQFIHRTFAEFFIAKYFHEKVMKTILMKHNLEIDELLKHFLEIVKDMGYVAFVVKLLNDSLDTFALKNIAKSTEIIQRRPKKSYDFDKDEVMSFFPKLIENGYVDMFTFLTFTLMSDRNEALKCWFDKDKKSVLLIVVQYLTPLHLSKILSIAQKEFEDSQFDEFIHSKTKSGQNIFQYAARKRNHEVFKSVLKELKSRMTSEKFRRLLTETDSQGRNFLFDTFQGFVSRWDNVLSALKDEEVEPDDLTTLLATTDCNGNTLLTEAAQSKSEVSDSFFKLFRDRLKPEELKELLFKRIPSGTVLMLAATSEYELVLNQILDLFFHMGLAKNELQSHLLEHDKLKRTALHLAAMNRNPHFLQRVSNFYEENSFLKIRKSLMMSSDTSGANLLIKYLVPEAALGVWELLSDSLSDPELKNLCLQRLLKRKINPSDNEPYVNTSLMNYKFFHEYYVDVFSQEEKLEFIATFNSTDFIEKSSLETVQSLFSSFNQVLSKAFTTKKTQTDQTVLHLAIRNFSLEVFNLVLNEAHESMDDVEFQSMLLQTDKSGYYCVYDTKHEDHTKGLESVKPYLTQESFEMMANFGKQCSDNFQDIMDEFF